MIQVLQKNDRLSASPFCRVYFAKYKPFIKGLWIMNISSKFLPVLLAGTVLSSPAAAVLAPAVDDIIEYTEGTAEDYNFIMPEADANGVQTNKYYKLVFVPGELSSSPNLSWVEVGEDKKDEKNVVAVNLPGNQVKYFQYTYQENDASHDYNSVRLVNLSGEVNADFAGIEYSNITVTGGAAYNSGAAVDNINGDFVNNSALSGVGFAQGGALYNGNKPAVRPPVFRAEPFITITVKSEPLTEVFWATGFCREHIIPEPVALFIITAA